MTQREPSPGRKADLRRQAEAKAACSPENAAALSPEETRRLLHELQVHQVELEMQNEELRRAQAELDVSRARYFDLYDLAPVGYLSLGESGLVLEANLTAAGLLGVARGALAKQPITRFVVPEDQDIYYRHRKHLLETLAPQVCELRMLRADAAPFWVRLEATVAQDGGSGGPVCRVVMSDVSERKQIEDAQAFLVQGSSWGSGEDFFRALARYLAQNLDMDFVCIDRLLGDGLTAQTVAVYHDGKFDDNIAYALKDTPCGDVVGKTICCYPKDVCRLFPKDAFLQRLKAESYAGTTLWGFDGKPIGLIAVIGRKPLAQPLLAESILKLVAIRAAAEMERKQAEGLLQAAHDRLFTVLESITDAFFSLDRGFRLTYVNREAERILRKTRQELLGRNLWELFPEAVSSPFQREYERATAENATVHFEAFYPPFGQWFGVHAYPSPDGLSVYFEDITGRKRAEIFVRAANALLGLLPAKLTRKDYMDAVVELLRDWTGCRCAGIRSVGEEGRLPCEAYVGFSREFWNQENRLFLGRDACACTRVALGEPLPPDAPAMTPDGSFVCCRLTEFAERLSREDAAHYRGICIQSGFESLALIPLRHQGQVTGLIHLADETPDMLPPETVQLLEAVAPLIGSVIHRLNLEEAVRLARDQLELRVQERTAELAERAEQLRALAVELTQAEHRERRRLAQVLHDHLQQLLVAARLKVAMLRHSIRDDQAATTIGQLDELLTETINESRSLAVQLCPPVLYTAGLAAGLEWLARETGEKFDLAVEVEADPAAEPAAESSRVLLFHVAGELLLNVAKHAQARRVWIRMHRSGQEMHVEVRDDGRGFDAAQPARKTNRGGFGLFSIRERLAALGGRMEVLSSPGRGTRISILMPRGNAD